VLQKNVWRANIILATADGCGSRQDHAPIQQIEACGVGMAGAFYGERR
jgi:hypothetical protein